MPTAYAAESLITLSEARLKFGYTSDHLAYLCRNEFVWAQRHGRLWLTCERAVMDYQSILNKTGKPEKYFDLAENQDSPAAFQASPRASWLGGAKKLLQKAAAQKPLDSVRTPLKVLAKRYKAAFACPRMPKLPSAPSELSLLGFSIGAAPRNLPQAALPTFLEPKIWYRNALVTFPVLILLFGISTASHPQGWNVLAKSALNTFSSISLPVLKANHDLQNTGLSFLRGSQSAISDPAEEVSGAITLGTQYGVRGSEPAEFFTAGGENVRNGQGQSLPPITAAWAGEWIVPLRQVEIIFPVNFFYSDFYRGLGFDKRL